MVSLAALHPLFNKGHNISLEIVSQYNLCNNKYNFGCMQIVYDLLLHSVINASNLRVEPQAPESPNTRVELRGPGIILAMSPLE